MEALLINGVTESGKILGSVVAQRLGWALGVKDELKKLKGTLETIAAVTIDAEKKQEESKAVKLWLKRLKDVVYDADDVLDEFSYESMRQRNKVKEFFSSSNPIVFNFKLGKKIKNINKRLDDISIDMKSYQFNSSENSSSQNIVQQNRFVPSFEDKMVLGRDNDKSAMINMLTTVQEFSVVSIVGMGGIGKSTLADMVYKDDSVKSTFDLRAWVCVSDDFNFKKILINIIESLTNHCDNVSNEMVLINKVREQLSNKKYLLVLDDLWNEDQEEWDKLKGLLVVGAHGSKVLVTTRSNAVASIVRHITPPYMLKGLGDSVCWSIIRTKAFSDGGASETPNMICIGKKIAKECGGVPLAANVLGNVLRLNKTETDWQSVLDHNSLKTNAETKIMSILKLSYDKLPLNVKLCFSYCSLFPKDWVIEREVLIRLWMAEVFLHASHGGNQISQEDVGDYYFHRLLDNSFFQDVTKNELGRIETCKMHDLVHDLSLSVNGVHDIKIVNSGEMDSVSEFRRLQLNLDGHTLELFSKVFKKTKGLRSILWLKNDHFGEGLVHLKSLRVVFLIGYHNLVIQSYSSVHKLKHLRYLDLYYCKFQQGDVSINQLYNLQTLALHGCINVELIVVGIGSLKMLRHLILSHSDVKNLPDSVLQLTDLQTLDLSYCRNLVALPDNFGSLKNLRQLKLEGCKLKALPRDLGGLTRLRYLDFSGTHIKELSESCINNLCNLEIVVLDSCECPKGIKNWPKLRILRCHHRIYCSGIENLICLEKLKCYIENRDGISCSGGGGRDSQNGACGSGIEELVKLNSLQELEIHKMELVRSGIDAERANLKYKMHLRKLLLKWGSSFEDGDEMASAEVLESLEPNSNLRELEIDHFPGLKLPKWMGSSNCLPNLVEIELRRCNGCEKLQALGMLPCLKVLEIWHMESVKCLGEEFYYQEPEYEERISSNGSGSTKISLFPSLVHLEMKYMTSLEEWVAPQLQICNSFPSLEKLEILNCPKLRSIPNSFPFLKKLNLENINSKAVTSIFTTRGGLTSLTSIDISSSPKLMYIPVGILLQNITPNLQQICIHSCYKFQGFVEDVDLNDYYNNKDGDCDEEDDSESTQSFSCPEINSNSNNITNSLRSLTMIWCPVLTLLPDLRSFTSLRELWISKCDKLKDSIPYDLKTLVFLEGLNFDFIQPEYEHPEDPADKSLRIENRCYPSSSKEEESEEKESKEDVESEEDITLPCCGF